MSLRRNRKNSLNTRSVSREPLTACSSLQTTSGRVTKSKWSVIHTLKSNKLSSLFQSDYIFCLIFDLILSCWQEELDWKYIAMVVDRLFLYLFSAACLCGTFTIFLYAPSLYDPRNALTMNDVTEECVY